MFRIKVKTAILKLRLICVDDFKKATLYSKYLGVNMGENIRISGRVYFGSEPYLVTIGNNVNLTQNVRFITHEVMHLFRGEYPGINSFGKISIGNNVVIGANALILPNVEIGNDTIIGAGSIVAKSIPDHVVAAGNPAKVIMSINEYKKRKLKNAVFVFEQDPDKRKKEILEKLQ